MTPGIRDALVVFVVCPEVVALLVAVVVVGVVEVTALGRVATPALVALPFM